MEMFPGMLGWKVGIMYFVQAVLGLQKGTAMEIIPHFDHTHHAHSSGYVRNRLLHACVMH